MNDPDHPRRDLRPIASGNVPCHYCGTTLDPSLYFCPNCSTPVQRVEEVLPRVSAPYLSDSKRVELLAPGSIRVFWAYLGLILGAGIVGVALFGPGDDNAGAFHVFFGLVFSAFTLGFAVFHFPTLAPQFRRTGFGHPAAWIGLFLLLPLLGVNFLYQVVFVEALGLDEILEYDSSDGLFTSRAALVLFVAVIPGITEEIAYRGLIQEWLEKAIEPRKAITVASFLFAISHFSVFSFPYLFAAGWLLGWMKWKTRSLFPSMVVHFLHNFAVITWME